MARLNSETVDGEPRCKVVRRDSRSLDWLDVVEVARHGALLELSDECWQRIERSRAVVNRIVDQGVRAYGINTGLGGFSDILLAKKDLSQLSVNTLLSHACGMGPLLSNEQTRAIMCVAVNNFAHGYSGIQRDAVELLIDLLNAGVTPEVPRDGSVGYLTHMAHIALTLIGTGRVRLHGQSMPAAQALSMCQLTPLSLGPKDGLSLVSGTPCMTGIACLVLADAQALADWADTIAAMTFEVLGGQLDAIGAEALALKPYAGIQQVGRHLRALLEGSELLAKAQGIRTQDALSIRSIPQVHGAYRDQLADVERRIATELSSATDNPLIMGDVSQYRVVSCAHPHGESIAMAMDSLSIAVAELSGISERRVDRMVNPLVSGLPPFLTTHQGRSSGLMVIQYSAASSVSELRRLAQPAVVDNQITSALQEDHLSFGTSAALKAATAAELCRRVLAIEYLTAAHAYSFHCTAGLGAGTNAALAHLRDAVPALDDQRCLAEPIQAAIKLLEAPCCAAYLEPAD